MLIKVKALGNSVLNNEKRSHATFNSEDFSHSYHVESGVEIHLKGYWFTTTFEIHGEGDNDVNLLRFEHTRDMFLTYFGDFMESQSKTDMPSEGESDE